MRYYRLQGKLGIAAAIALALVPVVHMLVILMTTGENSIHDDAHVAASFAALIRAGDFGMDEFLKAIYSTGSVLLFPLLVQFAVTIFADLNEFVVIFIGWFSSVIRWLLLFDMLSFRKSGWRRWIYLPITSSLVFLPPQIAQYSFGYASLQYYFSHLGLTLGLWSLVRFPGTGRAVWIAAGAGLFGSWSSGLGPLAWPVFALTMAILRYRKLWQWLVIVGSGTLATLPYLYFLTSDAFYNEGVKYSPDLLNIRLMLAQLGWAFFRLDNEQLRMVGAIGVALLCTGLGAAFLARRYPGRALPNSELVPAFMFIFFGILTVNQISALRGGLGAHRSAQYLSFWIGLVALALELLLWWLATRRESPQIWRTRVVFVPIWSAVTLLIIGGFAVRATDFEDYVHFLNARTPASAACLRAYQTAPTYCRDTVFSGTMVPYSKLPWLGELLENEQLLVFGRRQRWTMQGDTILGAVRGPTAFAGQNRWIRGRNADNRMPWSSYRRLNLVLPAEDTVEWTVKLPDNLRTADFESAVTVEDSARGSDPSTAQAVTVTVEAAAPEDRQMFETVIRAGNSRWSPITFPLTEFAGSTITIRLASRSESGGTGSPLVFRYPKIELSVAPTPPETARSPIAPINTEKSRLFPLRTAGDLCFDLADPEQWAAHGMRLADQQPPRGWSWELALKFSNLASTRPLEIDLRSFSHFFIRQRGDGGRGADYDLVFRFANGDTREVTVALLNDRALHAYTYDLRLLEAPDSLLESLKIVAHPLGFGVRRGTFLIEDVCLVARPSG